MKFIQCTHCNVFVDPEESEIRLVDTYWGEQRGEIICWKCDRKVKIRKNNGIWRTQSSEEGLDSHY